MIDGGWRRTDQSLTSIGRVLFRLHLIEHEMRGSVVRMRGFWQKDWR